MSTTAERLVWRRRRERRGWLFGKGDARLWESTDGRFRLRQVRRVAGVAVRAHWQAIERRIVNVVCVGPCGVWELISRHRRRSAAIAACERARRKDEGQTA